MKKIFLFTCLAGALPAIGLCQVPVKKDTVKREVLIHHKADDNKVSFSTTTPPLQQIQGAPKAFYEYYWEFGDGDFSTEPTPTHIYKKEGEHTVRQWTTNNYDNGKPPPSRPQKVPVKKITYAEPEKPSLPGEDIFQLKNMREPVPEEEMVVIVHYKNDGIAPSNGKLYLFYNEKKFKANNFSVLERRMHHHERIVQEDVVKVASTVSPFDALNPVSLWASTTNQIQLTKQKNSETPPLAVTLTEARSLYKDSQLIEFDNLGAGESRNIFISFATTPEMLKDTSAIVKIKGVYVPDRGADKHTSKDLEMEIVTSHDPNKMSVSDTRLNYRFYKGKENGFKIRFQNNGEGPAKSIRLETDVPEVFDKYSLKLKDVYPPCPVCPDAEEVTYSCIDTLFKKGKIIFHFKNVYLPGSNQDNVKERDSTKGFVRYTLAFGERVPKERTTSRTAIIFDKNEPVLTNYAHTRFKPGISIGAKAGYNAIPDLTDSKNYFIGATISPYKAPHGYLQVELMMALHNYSDSLKDADVNPENGSIDVYREVVTFQKDNISQMTLSAVPISYCYTINKFLSISSGIQFTTSLSGKTTSTSITKTYFYYPQQNLRQHIPDLDTKPVTVESKNKNFASFDSALFGGIQLGLVQIGPSAGVRYVYNLNNAPNQIQFYTLWKF